MKKKILIGVGVFIVIIFAYNYYNSVQMTVSSDSALIVHEYNLNTGVPKNSNGQPVE